MRQDTTEDLVWKAALWAMEKMHSTPERPRPLTALEATEAAINKHQWTWGARRYWRQKILKRLNSELQKNPKGRVEECPPEPEERYRFCWKA